jgi:hypothetical protein
MEYFFAPERDATASCFSLPSRDLKQLHGFIITAPRRRGTFSWGPIVCLDRPRGDPLTIVSGHVPLPPT